MKKKITFVVFIALAAIAYGQEVTVFTTSSGKVWTVVYSCIGKYEGQYRADTMLRSSRNPQRITLANRDHEEIVDKVLSYYRTSAGDTFFIMFAGNREYGNYANAYNFVCEIKSNGSYVYWLWYDL